MMLTGSLVFSSLWMVDILHGKLRDLELRQLVVIRVACYYYST